MNAKNNDWVSIEYEGKFSNGEVFDKNDSKKPLYFQIGAGMVIPGFENAVLNMDTGKEKTVTIKAKEGYGEKNKTINDIPKDAFAGQDLNKIELNKELQIMSNMGPLVIEIKSIEKDTIKAIINHPMAGKDLTFKIKLLKVLDKKEVEALQKEMSQHSCDCGHDCEHEHKHSHEGCECEDCDCETEEPKTKKAVTKSKKSK